MQTGVRWISKTNLIHAGVKAFYYPDAELIPLTLSGPVEMVRTDTFTAYRSGGRITRGPRTSNHLFREEHAWYDRAGNMVRRVERVSGYIDQGTDQFVYHADKPAYITEREIRYHQ